MLHPRPTFTFGFVICLKARKGIARLSSSHCVLPQRSTQVSQSFSKPMVLQLRHTKTPITRTLKRQPMTLWQRKYKQTVKDQGEDINGAPPPCPLSTTTFEARYTRGHPPWPVPLTNFAPVGGRFRTTLQRCEYVRHSSWKARVVDCNASSHLAENLRSYQIWS